MKMEHCPNCQKVTGHKRTIGIGTLIGGLFTLSVYLYSQYLGTRHAALFAAWPAELHAEQAAALDGAKALSPKNIA